MLSLSLPGLIKATGMATNSEQSIEQVIGLASDPLACLAVGSEAPTSASGTVELRWQGQAERARLIVNVAGADAPHTIRLNGQPVAQVPVQPEGQLCSEGEPFYLDISPEMVVQGNNLIEITDDALPGDRWSVSRVRVEVLGKIEPVRDSGQLGSADISASASTFTFNFTNAYDGSSSQEARAQIPAGHDGSTPAPLLVAIHPRNGNMYFGEETFGPEADSRGWLLVSPELHGSWPYLPDPSKPPGIYAYASLESQYDAIGVIKYMIDRPEYNVDTSRIYLVGYSMGGQGVAVTGAKYPHLFAAVFDNKGPADMYQWYYEQVAYYPQGENKNVVLGMRQECHIEEVPKRPNENPFCYQRRSGINFARNFIHVPISVTHSISDVLVPFHHSPDLVAAINSYDPDQSASVVIEDSHDPLIDGGSGCGYHCFVPDPGDVLDFFAPYTLNNTPTHISISTDESKSYYWLNIAQTGDEHWTQVEVISSSSAATVQAFITDTEPLELGFNLGSMPLESTAGVSQPGMGLPATTYLVEYDDFSQLVNYSSGYLTVSITSTGQTELNITPAGVFTRSVYLPAVIKNN